MSGGSSAGAGGALEPGRTVVRRVISVVWLLVVWVAFRGSATPASIIGGVAAAAVLMLLFRRNYEVSAARHRVHALSMLRYLVHFGYELVRANMEVALAVVIPSRVEHKRAIIEVPLPHSSRLVGAVLANAVSLTPGTSIIEVSEDPPAFHVHVLNMTDADATRSSIAELHWMLVRAIGPEDARADVEAHAAELRQRVAGRSGRHPAGGGRSTSAESPDALAGPLRSEDQQ